MESTTLYYREGSSDKVYQATIEPKDNGYLVNFAFGRRGTTLNTGTKTQSPVPLEQAQAIYQKLLKEKMAKGYTPGEAGTAYAHTDKAALTTGIHCQLLSPITAEQAEFYLNAPEYVMQEKFDGRRLLIQKKGADIIGINRQGLQVALPQPFTDEVGSFAIDITLDGEAVGDTFHAFDLLALGASDWTKKTYLDRLHRLMNVLAGFQHPHIRQVESAYLPAEKRELFGILKAQNKEGVVFKHADALYIAGRPASGGPQLKYKFYESASLIVEKVNAKRSVSLVLQKDGAMVPAGNVTIPPNHDIPAPGQIVECRYLYAFPESGHLYQPTYLGKREDLTAEDCTVDQLKYKPTT
jgi:bifunctional non-homologous end joining protein LigD